MCERFGGPYSYEELTDPNGKWRLSPAQMIERERCVASILYLATSVLSALWPQNLLDRPSEAHRKVEAALLADKPLLYVGARKTAKTTLCDEADTVHELLRRPDATILLSHSVDAQVKALSRSVRVHFERNAKLRGLFPEYRMDEDTNVNSWSVPCRRQGGREASVTAATPGKQTAGMHFSRVKMTDWMNEQTTPLYGLGSLEEMLKLVALTSQVIGLLQDKSVCPHATWSLDTNRWSDADQAASIIENDVNDAVVKVVNGVEMEGDGKTVKTPAWPEVQSKEDLQAEHDSALMTDAMWAANFEGKPRSVGAIQFLRSKFHDYGKGSPCQACGTIHPDPVGLRDVGVLVDPSFADDKPDAKKTDRTGVVAAGYDEKSDLYVVNSRAGRWGAEEFVNNVYEVVALEGKRDPYIWVGIEDTGGSRALKVMFEARLKREGTWVNVRELKHGTRSKKNRISPLHGFVSRYGMYLRLPEDAELMNELLRWGVAKHDDLADCMAYRALETSWAQREAPKSAARPREIPPTPRTTGTDILDAINARSEAKAREARRRMRRVG